MTDFVEFLREPIRAGNTMVTLQASKALDMARYIRELEAENQLLRIEQDNTNDHCRLWETRAEAAEAKLERIAGLEDKWACGEKHDSEEQIEARRDCADELRAEIDRDK